ncbi:MAG: ABC transporter permease [Halobellus sp.]
MTRLDRLRVVFERELTTVRRTRTYLVLSVGFALLATAIAVTSGVSGYVPLLLSLVTPLELLVPLLAGAYGYPAIVGARTRDELEIHQTYPVTRAEYVGGIYLARAAALSASVVVPLLLLLFAVPVFGPRATPLPQSTGLDSPVLYLRFVVLTAALACVTLALFQFVSAVAGDRRRGLVATLVGALVVLLGFDAVAVVGLGLGSGAAATVAVLGPTGAYRELTLALAVAPATASRSGSLVDVAVGGTVLLGWLVASLALAAVSVWRPVESAS